MDANIFSDNRFCMVTVLINYVVFGSNMVAGSLTNTNAVYACFYGIIVNSNLFACTLRFQSMAVNTTILLVTVCD